MKARLLLARVSLVALAVLLALLGFECGLQVFGPPLLRDHPLPFRLSSIYRYREQHPIFGVFHIPGARSWNTPKIGCCSR